MVVATLELAEPNTDLSGHCRSPARQLERKSISVSIPADRQQLQSTICVCDADPLDAELAPSGVQRSLGMCRHRTCPASATAGVSS